MAFLYTTSAYTSSEKPAWSFVQDIDHCYRREQGERFMGICSGRCGFQKFTDDMTCETCCPTPKTVIFDRISLGCGQKHVKDSLRPPTLVSEHTMVRQSLDYTPQQQVLPGAMLRGRSRTDPLMEDVKERLCVVSLSPLKHAVTRTAPEDLLLSTPSDSLSTPRPPSQNP